MKLIIDEAAQCVGCRQCELICSLKHEKSFSPWLARIHVRRDENIVLSEPIICRQCPDAPCLAACPVSAILQSEVTGAYYVGRPRKKIYYRPNLLTRLLVLNTS